MSSFEFILILIAIVDGFAISEILKSWGRLIRARVHIRHFGLYLRELLWRFGFAPRI